MFIYGLSRLGVKGPARKASVEAMSPRPNVTGLFELGLFVAPTPKPLTMLAAAPPT